MVATAIEKITKFVYDEQIPAMKKWSERYRKNGYKLDLIKQIQSLLRLISGNDVLAMLKGNLTEKI